MSGKERMTRKREDGKMKKRERYLGKAQRQRNTEGSWEMGFLLPMLWSHGMMGGKPCPEPAMPPDAASLAHSDDVTRGFGPSQSCIIMRELQAVCQALASLH